MHGPDAHGGVLEARLEQSPAEGIPFVLDRRCIVCDPRRRTHVELIADQAGVDLDRCEAGEAAAAMTRWAHERPRRLGRLHTRAGRLIDFTLTEPLQRLSVGSETEAEERSPVERERCRALLEQFLAGVS